MSSELFSRKDPYLPALEQAQRKLRQRKLAPQEVARLADVRYQQKRNSEGTWILPAFGKDWEIEWPSLKISNEGDEVTDAVSQVSLINYLAHADGTLLTGEWAPWQTFAVGPLTLSEDRPGYLPPLSMYFGNDTDAFRASAERLGGQPAQYGDAAYVFAVFPCIPVLVIYSAGDEEIPASSALLLDRSADHYLPIEDLSGVISWIQYALSA